MHHGRGTQFSYHEEPDQQSGANPGILADRGRPQDNLSERATVSVGGTMHSVVEP